MQIRLINKIWENGRMINSPYSYMRLIPKDGLHPTHKKLLNRNHREIYQSRRFYLDEYPQQELLREEYFKPSNYSFTFWTEENGLNVIHYFEFNYEDICIKTDLYFEKRWLKRN